MAWPPTPYNPKTSYSVAVKDADGFTIAADHDPDWSERDAVRVCARIATGQSSETRVHVQEWQPGHGPRTIHSRPGTVSFT